MGAVARGVSSKRRKRADLITNIKENYQLHVLMLIVILWFIIFRYVPMYGIQIAFKDFSPIRGFWKSPWVGLKNFNRFLSSYLFGRIIWNTIGISFYGLLAGFPVPLILALSLNSCENKFFKKTVQMVTYAPHFISTVVMVGIILQFLSPTVGIVNVAIQALGFQPVSFMSKAEYFKSIFVWSGVWQGMGWGTIIYLAALAGIDTSLHEAAICDGATRWQRTWHIDIPGIMPTAVILLILAAGQIMNVGFERVYLMQNALNLRSSEVISTYVYKVGLQAAIPDYSYGAAIGLFNSSVNFVLILTVNLFARRFGETSLW